MAVGTENEVGRGGAVAPAGEAVRPARVGPAGAEPRRGTPAKSQPGAERAPPGGPLAGIPWRHRLSTKLLAVVAVLTLAAVAAFMAVEWAMQRQRLRGMTESAELFSDTIKSSTWRAMLEDRRQDAYTDMEVIGRQRGIDHVRIINKEGRITFSSRPDEIGLMLDKRAEACYACHAADLPLSHINAPSRARVYNAGAHRVLGMITPVYNDPACYSAGCHAHPQGRQVLGVLDVGLSLAELDRDMTALRRSTLLATAMAVLLLAAFFYLFAQAQVVRPVAALLEGTRRVAHDQLEVEIRTDSRGEMGLLAASFNDMTRSLRRLENELHQLMEGLETKVEERTAELKAAQDQMVRTEKLSSLGKLSASIAHEINNPLAGILTFAKLMIRTLDQGPVSDGDRKVLMKNLGLVQRETERCSAIVRNLLDFARERPLALKEVDINHVVEEALSLIAHQSAIQNVVLERDLAPVPRVVADFGQLRQAFVNIAMNAVEAMGEGGRLSVVTRPRPHERQVEVVLTDTGPGITPELMQKIFDPFFTTKEKGTGLGLSVVYGIVERHHGKVEVETGAGKGTRFTIRLPALGPEE
ncbi:MAG TPA: ATP-binding protein [Anaeromyxobacteraceae bacterium]|nr:ATP-binding protein [Anaeromyxobacteraceae bacterium]